MLTIRHDVDKFASRRRCDQKSASQTRRPVQFGTRMNTRLIITLLCAGAVALACGSLSRNESSVAQNSGSARHSKTSATDTRAPEVNGNFAVDVEPHALRFALHLTNQSKKNVELAFPNGQVYEFTVLDSVGREVYRWGAGRMFTQSVQNKLIDGGDTMRIDERADTTLPRGRYVAVATLRSTNYPMTQSSTFELR
jgi:hypothetical protein